MPEESKSELVHKAGSLSLLTLRPDSKTSAPKVQNFLPHNLNSTVDCLTQSEHCPVKYCKSANCHRACIVNKKTHSYTFSKKTIH